MHYTQRPVAKDLLLAASCHNLRELQQAQALGVDFAVLSPVKPTASHPHGPPLTWSGFAGLLHDSAVPLYALGGMGLGDMPQAMAHGAHGVAMLSAVWEATDIAAYVSACLAHSRW